MKTYVIQVNCFGQVWEDRETFSAMFVSLAEAQEQACDVRRRVQAQRNVMTAVRLIQRNVTEQELPL